jgi:hypothetical protein
MNKNNFVSWLFIIGCILFFITSCGTPPGKGRKAEAGYRAAAPVIAALEEFHNERDHYPTNLIELAPGFLPNSKALLYRGGFDPIHSPRADAIAVEDREFFYRSKNDSFSLTFVYAGPGMNTCSYDSKTKKWSASGYY